MTSPISAFVPPRLLPFSRQPVNLPLVVGLGERSYPIAIGQLDWPTCLRSLPELSGPLAVVVSNPEIAALYSGTLVAALKRRFERVELRTVAEGEQAKCWNHVEQLCDELAALRAGRDVVLVALGGGVIGDLTGFVAGIYMRGVRFVQVPTTLLAQVDSSVGGKTGINLSRGKNLVGCFHQPQAVWADSRVLASLPTREYAAGLAEVIKYGPIADLAFFEWIESNIDALVGRQPDAVAVAVRRSCEIKAALVAADEREEGVRAALNFGHTFGHGLERGLGYGALLHGEAVAIGMVMATELSVRCCGLEVEWGERLRRLLLRAGLPVRCEGWAPAQLVEWMRTDKKAAGGAIRYVLVPRWGTAASARVSDDDVLAVLAQMRHG